MDAPFLFLIGFRLNNKITAKLNK